MREDGPRPTGPGGPTHPSPSGPPGPGGPGKTLWSTCQAILTSALLALALAAGSATKPAPPLHLHWRTATPHEAKACELFRELGSWRACTWPLNPETPQAGDAAGLH